MTIYKYRAVNQRTLELLINKKIYFSAPSDLNDPLDCAIDIESEYLRALDKYNQSENEKYKATLLRNINELCRGVKHNSLNENNLMSSFVKRVGVFSASKNERDALLWSHYGDSHKGICLGFDESLLPKESIIMRNRIGYSPAPVYQELFEMLIKEFVEVLESEKQDGRYHEELAEKFYKRKVYTLLKCNLMIKSSKWEYEKEYRLVSQYNGLISFDPKALTEIILGIKTSERDKETLNNILCFPEYSHVKLRKTIHVNGSFDFSIEDE